MPNRSVRRTSLGFYAGCVALACGLAVSGGCGQTGKDTPPDLRVQAPGAGDAPGQGQAQDQAAPAAAADPRFAQDFFDATLQDPPGDQTRPPDMTRAGKPTWQIYKAVAGDAGKGGLWEQVRLVGPDGRPIRYTAVLKTDAGDITLELLPEVAPNHVRNFIALARAGYYDGLQFDRAVEEEVPTDPGKFLKYIEAGCPRGTGDANSGSIGYWMKPEISDQVRHEPGTVGAAHGPEVETAACKFYVTLDSAPWIDGQYTIFAKVTQGLEVARVIFARPKQAEIPDRPQAPVTIRSVTIHAAGVALANNKTG